MKVTTSKILVLVFLLAFLLGVGAAQGLTEDYSVIYNFEEPANLYWLTQSHMDITYPCAENFSRDYFLSKVGDLFNYSSKEEIDELVENFSKECGEGQFFYYKPKPLPEDIKQCYDHLANIISDIDPYTHSSREIIKECYIRKSSEEKRKLKSLDPSEEKKVQSLISDRDEEFKEFVGYSLEYFEIRPLKTKAETINDSSYETYDEEQSHYERCRPELGDRCKNETDAKVDNTTATEEPVIVPSKSVISSIKGRLKNFFRWLS